MTMLNDQDIEQLARTRAARKTRWYVHAAVYVAVNGMLLLMAFAGGRQHWPVFPALGWGFALALHALRAFGPGSGALQDRLLERERRKLLHARERAPWA